MNYRAASEQGIARIYFFAAKEGQLTTERLE